MLAGAYPASLDDAETEQLLSLLLELGVNTFVCLQAEVNIHIPGEGEQDMWVLCVSRVCVGGGGASCVHAGGGQYTHNVCDSTGGGE